MTPQELKNSILQLAVQGKLVEQRPEEGTGEELYQQIQAEKQRLIKAGKIKKEKPLPEISEDEIPFEIPESWKWYRIGELFNIVNGFTPLKSNPEFWTEGDIPWFTIEDVHRQGRFISSTEKFITRKALSKNTERIVPADTVLLCCTASVGEYAYTKIPLTTNQQFNAFVVKEHYKDAVYPLYVFEYAKTLKGFLIDRAGKTTFNFVSVGKLSNMLIPLPPPDEQKRIVAKIEELLPYIDRYEKAWSRLEDFNKRFPVDMQKSILQMAIQGKLVEQRPEEGTGEELYQQIQTEKQKLIKEGKIKKEKPLPEIADDETPFDIPENWKWVKISQLAMVLNGDRGKNYPAKSTLSHTGIPFISALNLNGKSVVDDDNLLRMSEQQYERLGNGKLIKDDIVVCIRGSLGKHGRYPFERGAIASSLVILRPFFVNSVMAEFLMLYLDTPLFFSEIRKYNNGTAQPNLAAKSLEGFMFPLPPLAEQKRIIAKLEEILPLCERLK